eukprot:Platyproteum_vivax@DN7253_c0_g2_i1.p1
MSRLVDLVVIGGGSGGMAAAKEAAQFGAKVVLFDFVKPSTQGTTWGLGGTCVNVGCVPKKLMHYASNMGEIMREDASHYGWKTQSEFTWSTLVQNVQNHVKRLNFTYRGALRSTKVEYINAYAELVGPSTVSYTLKDKTEQIEGKHIIIAVGGRPIVPPEVKNAQELAITSDDIFSLKKMPGKTLVVGGSYIALETAGFLKGLGFPVTVLLRSIALRGFDRQCSEKVAEVMAEAGIEMKYGLVPTEERTERTSCCDLA